MSDRDDLVKAGYIVKRLSPYHVQVSKPGSKIVVNVWPTVQKILQQYVPGPAPYYKHLLEEVEAIFEADSPAYMIKMAQRYYDEWQKSITPEMREAQRLHEIDMDRLHVLLDPL